MSTEREEVRAFREFFGHVLPGAEAGPYSYQEVLATRPWPDLLDVPTGLGKTAAVTIAWLFKRLQGDADTPRRLIWCFPMRVLVEQTRDAIVTWLGRAARFFEERRITTPECHVLMGGEFDQSWLERPEDPAILIGTQDMLLSRALMRGYGSSRYRWPIEFAFVQNDALWAFDEVQLMGAGLTTSAQLEAFRRDARMPTARPSRSIWLSATLRPEWIGTVDFRAHLAAASILRLLDEDRSRETVRRRLTAPKSLHRSAVPSPGTTAASMTSYASALADIVCREHTGEAPTLVVLNSVERAQRLASAVKQCQRVAGGTSRVLLVHARFRQSDREQLNERIREIRPSTDTVVIATQAIEAGVDMTSRRLFTEIAPWSSLVQRFGRCNRAGEYSDAAVHWIDLDTSSDAKLALPYNPGEIAAARSTLESLRSASIPYLPKVTETYPLTHVIRRNDFIDLFNTDPDLSGFDIDVSLYIRDGGSPQVQVFWRNFADEPGEQSRPARAELCPASLSQIRAHLSKKRQAFRWDALVGKWDRIAGDGVKPGQTLMLRSVDGGYNAELGFVPGDARPVPPIDPKALEPPPGYDDDEGTQLGRFVELSVHLSDVAAEAGGLCDGAGESGDRESVVRAALWHDVGKAHPAAQTAYLDHASDPTRFAEMLWAKSAGRGRPRYRIESDGTVDERRHFRHELASMLAWLEHGDHGDARDLVAYLIAAHHGKVRLGVRALEGELVPRDGRLFARGIRDGDRMPPVRANGLSIPATTLQLDIMRLGDGPMGASWTARTRRLLSELGPFRLAWLEALVRLADWRASAKEAMNNAADGR
jgi:CRISPR-associated endonuclease/helicase Cas3